MHKTVNYSEYSGDDKVIAAMNDIEEHLSSKALDAAIAFTLEGLDDEAQLSQNKSMIALLTGISGYPLTALESFCRIYAKWLNYLDAVDMYPYIVPVTMTDFDGYVWDSLGKTVKEKYVLKNVDGEGYTLQYRGKK